MTKRERYLKALRRETIDELVWAPNFDYWLHVNTAEGTLPEKYRGMSRNDIVRAIGGCIWNRAVGMRTVIDASVHVATREEDGASIHEYETPVGSVREVYLATESPHRTKFLSEHMIKDIESLRVVKYIAEATHYEPDYEPTLRALEETGDDGIVLNGCFMVPFIRFAKMDAGYANAYYIWADHRDEVESLLDVYMRKFLEGCRVAAEGPADVLATGDNMDGATMSPKLFKEYAVPFYQEARKITSAHGKLFEGHWCGRTRNLLHLVPGCGLDVVEAIVTRPMDDIGLSEAIDLLKGEVALQGGIPSVMVCEEGGSREDFERHIEEEVLPLKHRPGFVLGMSDNVPPNADFARVEAVAKLIS